MKSIGRRENQAWNGGGVVCGSKRTCGRGRTDTSPWCHALLWHTLYCVDTGVTRRSRRRHDVGKILHINDLHVNVGRRLLSSAGTADSAAGRTQSKDVVCTYQGRVLGHWLGHWLGHGHGKLAISYRVWSSL